MTVAMHEKGKTLDEAGGMLFTIDSWLAPKIAAMTEVMDFDMRYWKKMALDAAMPSADDMAQAFAMFPGLKDGMARLEKEKVNMDGTAIETITAIQSVQTKEQAAQKKQEGAEGGSPAAGLGGMLGRFGKKKEEPKPADAHAEGRSRQRDARDDHDGNEHPAQRHHDRFGRGGRGAGGVQTEKVAPRVTFFGVTHV